MENTDELLDLHVVGYQITEEGANRIVLLSTVGHGWLEIAAAERENGRWTVTTKRGAQISLGNYSRAEVADYMWQWRESGGVQP